MNQTLVMLSIPGLRVQDLPALPSLGSWTRTGASRRIAHSFPCVTWPSQCNVLTGCTPDKHGIIANGFFWREKAQVEMWTAWNPVILKPQIWDSLKERSPNIRTAAWFPMLAKGCGADHVCMPAPIHQPDGSEDMWCFTKPQEFYGELLEEFGHFPLQHFWGPLAGIQSSQWIADSAIRTAAEFAPDFWYIYLPHLDYAAQKQGPNSGAATKALEDLDAVLSNLIKEFSEVYSGRSLDWLAVSEYVISEVDHVTYPNRLLAEKGALSTHATDSGQVIDFRNSAAWALVDHQFSHIFVKDRDQQTIDNIVRWFEEQDGLQMVLAGDQRQHLNMDHERSGDVILVSSPNSWQAYYWWHDDDLAPEFARSVDIHRKPGYDPVELCFDMATKTVPLDASLIRGSHGAPAIEQENQGLLVASREDGLEAEVINDISIHDVVMNWMLPS